MSEEHQIEKVGPLAETTKPEPVLDQQPTVVSAEERPEMPRLSGTRISIEKEVFYSGPLPHPDMLSKYEQCLPGSAGQILKMAQNQQNHRMDMEQKVITSDIRRSNLGLIFAFILSLVLIGGAIYLISQGFAGSGLTLVFITIASQVGSFIYADRKRTEERKTRMKEEGHPGKPRKTILPPEE